MTPGDLIDMPMPADRPVRPREELVMAWLLLLLDRGASYGYDLCRELEDRSMSIDPSVVYRTLRRLEADKLVTSRWMKSLRGPQRRSYRITAKGRRRLDEIAGLIAAIRSAHDMFLHEHEQARGQRTSAA